VVLNLVLAAALTPLFNRVGQPAPDQTEPADYQAPA
jgi:hypothetical protein